GLAEQLGHHGTGGDAARQRVPVLPVTAHDVVVVAECRDGTDGDCLLADVEMAEPADFPQRVRLAGFFFKPADQHHLTQQAAVEVEPRTIEAGSRAEAGHGEAGEGQEAAVACWTWSQAW